MRTDRMRLGVLITLVAGSLGSAGCETMNNTEKGVGLGAATGAGLGLLAGAATGNPRTGAAVGGLLGAGIGGAVGNEADREDRAQRETQQAVAVAAAQAQQQRMGIADVIRLSQDRMDDQIIINQIRSTGSTFQLTASDLEMLQQNGVSPRVMSEMQAARGPAPVLVRPSTQTVIYEQPMYPPPAVIVAPRPYYYAPRPYYVVGGGYYRYR